MAGFKKEKCNYSCSMDCIDCPYQSKYVMNLMEKMIKEMEEKDKEKE